MNEIMQTHHSQYLTPEDLGGEHTKPIHSSIIYLLSASIVLVSRILLGSRDTMIKKCFFPSVSLPSTTKT